MPILFSLTDPQDPAETIPAAYAVRQPIVEITNVFASRGFLRYRIWRSSAAAKSNKSVQQVCDIQFSVGEKDADVKLSDLIGNLDEFIDEHMLNRPVFKGGKVVL